MVSEYVPSARSVAVNICVGCGSRNEPVAWAGISHLVEHMFFKGTEKRGVRQIAQTLEEVGGRLNGFTGKEMTCYFAQVIDLHLGTAFELISDMLTSSLLEKSELAKEKQVIMEEIGSYEDTPEEKVQEMILGATVNNPQFFHPVVGYKDTVSDVGRGALLAFLAEHYTLPNVIVSASGSVEHRKLVGLVETYLEPKLSWQGDENEPDPAELRVPPRFEERPLEMTHLCLGCPIVAFSDKRRYVLLVMDAVLGGTMSSRLFQKLREELGLVYHVQSLLKFFSECGILVIYCATHPKGAKKAIDAIREELSRLVGGGISDDELHRSKEYLKGSLALSLEHTPTRAFRLANQEFYLGYQLQMEETMELIDAVTRQEVGELAEELFDTDAIPMVALGKDAGKLF